LVTTHEFLRIICFSKFSAGGRKLLPAKDGGDGAPIALDGVIMRLRIRPKVTYGVLVLAFAMMLADVCKLLRSPSGAALAASTNGQHVRKF
jgi:hypothetical protein